MKTLTLNEQKTQNTTLFNNRMSKVLTRSEILEFCKRATISVCCELIDSDVQDEFLSYYGWLPNYSINTGNFNMIKLR